MNTFNAVFAFVLVAALVHACAAQGPVIDWLKNNKDTTKVAAVLQSLYKKPIPSNAKFTFLVPTNQAIDAFRSEMGFSQAQFDDRTGLKDLVLAYHIIPGFQAKELKLAKSPAQAATGDINYMLRFTNTDKGVEVEDNQGNKVPLSKPVLIGNVAIIVIPKVLMSGAYFTDGKTALEYHPSWSEAAKFAQSVGFPEGTGRGKDLTLFVPDNKAMQAAQGALGKLTAEQKKNLFLYHVSAPARAAPANFKNGNIPTMFKGHDLTVSISVDSSKTDPVTGKPNKIPNLVLTSETGNKAETKIFNIHVGTALWQGINAVLVPKFDTKVTTEAGKSTKGGARRLLARGGSSWGIEQQYANTVAAENTAAAIEAAATGSMPTSYATKYGSVASKAATDCWNCLGW